MIERAGALQANSASSRRAQWLIVHEEDRQLSTAVGDK
jgi:hypothetical protein